MFSCPTTMGAAGKKNYPKPDGTWCTTKARHCTLYWRQERFRHTIPWDTAVNVEIIHSAPSSESYWVFVAAYEQEQQLEDIENFCYTANIVSDNEDE